MASMTAKKLEKPEERAELFINVYSEFLKDLR